MRQVFRCNGIRIRSGFAAIALLLGLGGCATYYLPANHLDTPEVMGKRPDRAWGGRLELGALQQGADLTGVPGFSYPQPASTDAPQPPPEPVVGSSFGHYSFGFMFPVEDKMEVGVRMQPMAPLLFRFKYQFSGEPESRSKKGNWSFAGTVSPGILLGSEATYLSADLALPVGYRPWEGHLFSVWPFFSYASLSGVAIPAAKATVGATTLPSSALTEKTSASATQYGAALGYQYVVTHLFLRVELAYILGGALNEAKIGGLYPGLLVGLSL